MTRMTRRTFGISLLAAGTLCSPAILRAQGAQRFDGITLRVGVFGGAWRDQVHANVGARLEELGARIEYVPGNPTDNFAKIVAARGADIPIDIMEIDPATRIAMAPNDFLEDLSEDLLPNVAKTSVQIVESTAVPYHMVQNGFVYRADKFEEQGLPVPASLSDLENDVYAGKLAFPDVANPQHWPAVTLLARANGGGEADPQPGFDAATRIRPAYYYGAATELAQRMSLGDVIGAPWHAGMAVRMARDAGQNMGIVHPALGDKQGEFEYNYLGIVKGTPNKEAAAAFINMFLDTAPQAGFSAPVGVVPVNVEARQLMSEDPLLSQFMLLSDNAIANAYTMDWSQVNVEKWRADWARTVN